MMDWKEWLLDITFGVEDAACFVPYEREDGNVVLGMNLLTDRCPGDLVGVIHSDGKEAVERWCSENPDWYERYKRTDAAQQPAKERR